MPCAVCPSILSTLQSPVLRARPRVMAGTGANGAGGGTAFLAACWLIQSAAVVAGRPQPVSSNTHRANADLAPLGTVHPRDSAASNFDSWSADPRCVRCKARFKPVRQIENCMRGKSPAARFERLWSVNQAKPATRGNSLVAIAAKPPSHWECPRTFLFTSSDSTA